MLMPNQRLITGGTCAREPCRGLNRQGPQDWVPQVRNGWSSSSARDPSARRGQQILQSERIRLHGARQTACPQLSGNLRLVVVNVLSVGQAAGHEHRTLPHFQRGQGCAHAGVGHHHIGLADCLSQVPIGDRVVPLDPEIARVGVTRLPQNLGSRRKHVEKAAYSRPKP